MGFRFSKGLGTLFVPLGVGHKCPPCPIAHGLEELCYTLERNIQGLDVNKLVYIEIFQRLAGSIPQVIEKYKEVFCRFDGNGPQVK